MSLFNAAKYDKQLADHQKLLNQQLKEKRQRERVNSKNRQLVNKYRNRVASFVKDILSSDGLTPEDLEAKMQNKEYKRNWQVSQQFQSARMVASGQSAFSGKKMSHSALNKLDEARSDIRSPMMSSSNNTQYGQFNVKGNEKQLSLVESSIDRGGLKTLFSGPNTTKHSEFPINLNEDSKLEMNSMLKTGSQFSTKYSQLGNRKKVSLPITRNSMNNTHNSMNNPMLIQNTNDKRFSSRGGPNQSVISYPASTMRYKPLSPPNSSQTRFRQTILSQHYEFKDSPRGFRYADSPAEKYVRNVIKNSEFDTEPARNHNQFVFGQVLRGDSRDTKKILSGHHMHLKSYLDADRICNQTFTRGGSQRFHQKMDGQFKKKIQLLQQQKHSDKNIESLPDHIREQVEAMQVNKNENKSLLLEDINASPRFISRMQKQIFIKRKMAAEATPVATKTHFKGGASILMNKEGQAKMSLNLKDTQEGACHQLEQLIQYKIQRNKMNFLAPRHGVHSTQKISMDSKNLLGSSLLGGMSQSQVRKKESGMVQKF